DQVALPGKQEINLYNNSTARHGGRCPSNQTEFHMTIKLHVFPPSPRAFKVLLAAHHLGIDYELKPVNLGAGDHRTPQFTSLNVNQRMPVLEDNGYVLWESNAILEYLAAHKPQIGLV